LLILVTRRISLQTLLVTIKPKNLSSILFKRVRNSQSRPKSSKKSWRSF
jgi:hypothetical protein